VTNSLTRKLVVAIVTYNSEDVVDHCLSALTRGLPANTQIVVVDNSSSDQTRLIVRRHSPVTLLENSRNVGFAVAVNMVAADVSQSCDLLLLNPDAAISGEAVARLQLVLSEEPRIGAVAPLVSQPSGRTEVMQAGHQPTIRRMLFHYSGISRTFGRRWPFLRGHYLYQDSIAMDRSTAVEWASGGCLMVRGSLWRDLGGLDESWFMYVEDTELCNRIRQRGSDVRIVPWIQATHSVGSSARKSASSISGMWITNLMEYYARDLAPSRLAVYVWKAICVVGLLSRSAGFFVRSLRVKSVTPVDWRGEARRFLIYALLLAKHPVPPNQTLGNSGA